MNTQTEQQLEDKLIAQLQLLGFELVSIPDEESLLLNLKKQLEKHNQILLSDLEFRQVLNKVSKGNIFKSFVKETIPAQPLRNSSTTT